MQTNRSGLWTATLVACGLLLAEDPAVIAIRQHLRRSELALMNTITIDLALATTMMAYNYAATRYVVRVSSADVIERAIATLDAERIGRDRGQRSTWSRQLRAAARAVNPFNLLKRVAELAGGAFDRVGGAAQRRGRAGSATLLGDLAIVNLLGVPGAGIQRAVSGRRVGTRESLRLCGLFVASWFLGAWAIEVTLDRVAGLPVVGGAVGRTWLAVDRTYATITDIGSPVGAVCVAVFGVVVLRYVRRVERRASAFRQQC